MVGTLIAYFPLVLVTAYIFMIWLILFRFSAETLAILIVGFYIYPVTIGIFGMNTSSVLTAIFYCILSMAALIGSLRKRSGALRIVLQQRENLIVVVFIGWIFVNWLTFSFSNDFALKKIGSIPWLMLIPFFVPQVMERANLDRFLKACIFVSLPGIISMAIRFVNGVQEEARRLSVSENVSPLGFAYSLGFSSLLAIIYGLSSKHTMIKVASIVYLLSAMVLIVSTGSRGPLLALGLGLLVAVPLVNRLNRLYLLLALGTSLWILLIAFPFVSSAAQARISALLPQTSGSTAMQLFFESRGYLWMYSLNTWLSHPIVGIGFGNYLVYTQNASRWEVASFAHNFIVDILTELGLIGFLIFGGFLLSVLKKAEALLRTINYDKVKVSTVSILVFALVKMSFSGQFQVSVEFWVACGLVLTLAVKNKTSIAVNRLQK